MSIARNWAEKHMAVFKDAKFDPVAFEAITEVMTRAIRDAVLEEREACSQIAATFHYSELDEMKLGEIGRGVGKLLADRMKGRSLP